jgi:hypothetical protein
VRGKLETHLSQQRLAPTCKDFFPLKAQIRFCVFDFGSVFDSSKKLCRFLLQSIRKIFFKSLDFNPKKNEVYNSERKQQLEKSDCAEMLSDFFGI